MASIKALLRQALPKNKFARGVSVLAGGTAAGQALLVLASPLLTRLYSPEDFGLLAVFSALLGILGVIASLRYQLAIPLPAGDEEAASVVALSLLVVLGMTLLSVIAVLVFREPIALAFNTPVLAAYLWLLPLGLLLIGSYEVFNYWAIRTGSFTAIARTKLTQAIGTLFVQIGAFSLGPLALLFGQVTGQAAGVTSLGLLAVKNRWAVFKVIRLGDIAAAAKRYRRFPIFSSWSGVFNTAGQQVPLLLFAALFNPAIAGIYMLAQRVLAMPAQLIGVAVGNVFFSRATEANRENKLDKLVVDVYARLVQMAMPPALIIILIGPELFSIVFGENWRQAGEFSQWLAVMLFIQFLISPLSNITAVLEKQVHGLALQVALFLIRLLAIWLGWVYGDEYLAVALYALGSAVGYGIFLLWIFRATSVRLRAVLGPLLRTFAISMLLVLPIIVVKMTATTVFNPMGLLLMGLTVILVAYYYVLNIKAAYRTEV